MAYGRKWKPSKSQAKEFAKQMDEINDFCIANHITSSYNNDSYYFNLNGVDYRVSNHSVESSDKGMYDHLGNKIRDSYHPNGREDNVVYIHASKTRIIEIYNDLKNGYELDGRGYRKN